MFHTSYTYKIYTATSQTGLIILTLSLSFLFCSGRLSAAQCLKHPWLNNISEKAKGNNIILKSQVLLRKYMARRLWKVKKKNSTFIHIKQYAIRNNLSMCSLSLSLLSCRKTILLQQQPIGLRRLAVQDPSQHWEFEMLLITDLYQM